LAERVAPKTAKDFFQNKGHGLCTRAPYGDQLGIPESLRERICRITRPDRRPSAGQEVEGALSDAEGVSRPGSDKLRSRCCLGS